jgi:hypothetical protein
MLFQPSGQTGTQVDWDELFDGLSELWDDAKTVTNYYSKIAGVISAAETLGHLLGLLAPAEDPSKKVIAAVNATAQGLSWQIADSLMEQRYANLLSTIQTIDTFTRSGRTYDFDSPGYQASIESVNQMVEPSTYWYVSVPQGNDGGSLSYPFTLPQLPHTTTWKSVISTRPTVDGMNRVYDWRRAVPLLMKMISMRLFVIGTVDPSFRTDHSFDSELGGYRVALKEHYDRLSAGIQCASANFQYAANRAIPVFGCNVVCADIYTGISAISSFTPTTPPAGQPWTSMPCSTVKSTQFTSYRNAVNSTAWAVRSKLPLFQLRSMIDQLYMFLHPAYDLTQRRQRITSEPAQNLCVNVQGGSPNNGTPLQLSACNGTPGQQWTYDRSTGQLRNGLGTCMDQRWQVNPGTVPGTWACDTPHGDPLRISNQAQMWSYDPESRLLWNGLGTALAASNFTQGAPLWNVGGGMGFMSPPLTRHAGDVQWRADQVLPSSSPGTLNAGEGLNTLASLYSEDGRFQLIMASNGDLLLWEVAGPNLLWSKTFGGLPGSSFAVMQGDGNFVVYRGPGLAAVWATDTASYPGSRFLVQNDGNLVIYDASNVPRWASNTCCH